MENYVAFRVAMYESLKDTMALKAIKSLTEIQWSYLKEGVRDHRIHDSAYIAWSRCGGKF